MTTTAYEIALDLFHADIDGIEDVSRYQDDNGNDTLARIDFTDGAILIAGEEEDGVTWTAYLCEEEMNARVGAVDGSDDLDDLGDVIRDMAAAAAED